LIFQIGNGTPRLDSAGSAPGDEFDGINTAIADLDFMDVGIGLS
jgi:hypothetical protein